MKKPGPVLSKTARSKDPAKVNPATPLKPQPESKTSSKRAITIVPNKSLVKAGTKPLENETLTTVSTEDILDAGQAVAVVTPPGLELLLSLSKASFGPAINILRNMEEAQFSRVYSIRDQSGQEMYYVGEKVGPVSEVLLQGFRPFTLKVFDYMGEAVMDFIQKCSITLCACSGECSGSEVTVTLADGSLLGSVQQVFSCCTPIYGVFDSSGYRIMTVVGEYGRVCFLCKAKSFRVFADIEKEDDIVTEVIATIGRRYVNFKEDVNVEMKTLILSAMFLLEMNYYRSCRGLRKVVIIVVLLLACVLAYRFSPLFVWSTHTF